MREQIPAGLTALIDAYRASSQAMRLASTDRRFTSAWRARDKVAAQILSMTGNPVEIYL